MAVARCHRCPRLFETSEEIANEPGPDVAGGRERLCPWCRGPRAAALYEHPRHRSTRREDCSACDATEGARIGFPRTLASIGEALDAAEQEESVEDELDRIRREARCGRCGGPLGETLTLVAVPYLADWEFFSAVHFFPDATPTCRAALGVCCGRCVAAAAPKAPTIGEVIELRRGAIVYHSVEDLEPMEDAET